MRPNDKPRPDSGVTASTNTRSVVTFYHEAFDDQRSSSSFPIKQEVDLLDYEVLVETYKFLAQNLRRSRQRGRNTNHSMRQPRLASRDAEEDSENEPPLTANERNVKKQNSNGDIVTDKHKQAILTLVEVDKTSKRVVRIRPEFFPSNMRILPACLTNLEALESLSLAHCTELTCLPAGLSFPQLEELHIDVTSFREPIPSKLFASLAKLEILVVRGTCVCLDDWRSKTSEESAPMLFPPTLAKIKNLKHLEIHARNLLQIPAEAFDKWSSSLETLVTTQDLLSSNNNNDTKENGRRMPPLRSRSYSTDDSSDDDFYHLMDSSDDDASDDGFSLLKHSSVFRKALESQLEVRAFRAIAKFQNLRSLKLLFDDAKHRTDFCNIRNRLKRKHQATLETPYCVPLSLLAGPLSLSLRELDIGTTVASTTPSSSKKKSRIPIELSWVDVLQDFPMLQTLRLQDCRASFSSKTQTVDLRMQDDETILCMPELRQLVLDRCPDFAVFNLCNTEHTPPKIISSTSSFQDDIEIIDEKDIDDTDNDDDDDEDEEIVFCPLPNICNDCGDENEKKPESGGVYFQPLKDADVDAMVEEDPEEISRIIRLSGLLADTVLTPKEEEDEDAVENQKLSDLCQMFLKRCPKLEIVTLRDCKIPTVSRVLLECLPASSLRELTLDVSDCNVDNFSWEVIEAYPALIQVQGTFLDSLSDSDFERLQRRLRHNRSQQGNHSPLPWAAFLGNNKRQQKQDNEMLDISSDSGDSTEDNNGNTSKEDRTPPPTHQQHPNNNALHHLAAKLFFFDHRRRQCNNPAGASGGRVLQTMRRSNSRDVL